MSGIEILGIAAGVVQIAELGGKLSVKLFTFTRKIKNADRNIDSISQDIAATGAVLQQLGNELKKDEKLRLCSPEAIVTARSLMEECHRIFKELDDAVDGKGKGFGTGTKVILGLRQRLKYPFLEPQIEMLKANLEKLKSSLLVMLNVLIFAEQLKNQEALPILKDQRELLKSLVEEKVASQNQYDLVLKRLDQLTVENEVSSISSLSKESTRTSDSSITLLNSSSRFPEASAPTDIGSLLPGLPGHLHHRAEEIFDHCRLINNVLEEIHHTQYKLDLGIRYRTQEMILDSHHNEWVGQVDAPRYDAYGNHLPSLYKFLESTPQLKRHWERKKQQDRRHQQQIQAHAQQERMRQMQMMQQAQMQKQRMQAQLVMQQQQAYQAAYPQTDPGTLRARQAAMQAQSQPSMQADQTGLAEVPPQAQPLRPLQQKQQQQGQHQHGLAYQRHQGIRATYDPRDPVVLATVPMTPMWPTSFGSVAQPSPMATPPQSGDQELQDYQTKLMLSEGQNKKRRMMARQEQEELFGVALDDELAPGTANNTNSASSDMPVTQPPSKRQRAGSGTHSTLRRSKPSNHKGLAAADNKVKDPQAQLDPSEGLSVLPAYSGSSQMHNELGSVESTPPLMNEAPTPSQIGPRTQSIDSRVRRLPQKRSESSLPYSPMLGNAPMAAQPQIYPVSFASEQDQQQHMQGFMAENPQALDDNQKMNLDFSTQYAGDVLENFDFDSFLASKDEVGLDFDRSERHAEGDEGTAVATTRKKTQGEGAQDPPNTVNVAETDDYRSSDDGEKGMSEHKWLTASAFDTDEDEDAGLTMAPSRSNGETRGAHRGRDIVPLPSILLGSRTDKAEPRQGKQPGLWPRGIPFPPSPSQETLRPSFLIDEGAELSDEPEQPSEYASKLPHDDEDESDPSIRRISAGMFMPYEETEEEDAMNSGLFGSVKNAAYTAKDMAYVVWNGGQTSLTDVPIVPKDPASESTTEIREQLSPPPQAELDGDYSRPVRAADKHRSGLPPTRPALCLPQDNKPTKSATFIPNGDSLAPGVGISRLESSKKDWAEEAEAVEQAAEALRADGERRQCTHPNCRKMFKDLKAHVLTHQAARPEKCPMSKCEYNQKGFARKHDKNRHTLTHYKGTMVCGFCPGSGTVTEKSFNRVDVFKRHLTSVHGVKPTLLQTSSPSKPSRSYQDTTVRCSTCSTSFSNAQDLYEHLDDCVVRVVQQQEAEDSAELPVVVSEAATERTVAPQSAAGPEVQNLISDYGSISRKEYIELGHDAQMFDDKAERVSEGADVGEGIAMPDVGRERTINEQAGAEADEEASFEPKGNTRSGDEDMIDDSPDEPQQPTDQRSREPPAMDRISRMCSIAGPWEPDPEVAMGSNDTGRGMEAPVENHLPGGGADEVTPQGKAEENYPQTVNKAYLDEQDQTKPSAGEKSTLNLPNPTSVLGRRRTSRNQNDTMHVPALRGNSDPRIRGTIKQDFSARRSSTNNVDEEDSTYKREKTPEEVQAEDEDMIDYSDKELDAGTPEEPSMTPVAERSERSTRDSAASPQGPPSSGIPGSAISLPSPGMAQLLGLDSAGLGYSDESDMTQSALMKLRRRTFGGSPTSVDYSHEPESVPGAIQCPGETEGVSYIKDSEGRWVLERRKMGEDREAAIERECLVEGTPNGRGQAHAKEVNGRPRLPETFSTEQIQSNDSMSGKDVKEGLTSILDFLERYTLLEGQDLERARTVVADA